MYPKKWKRTKKAVSIMTVFAMLSSAMGTTVAAASVRTDSQPVMSEESEWNVPVITEESGQSGQAVQPVMTEISGLPVADSRPVVMASDPVTPPAVNEAEPDGGKPEPDKVPANSTIAEDGVDLSYSAVYEKLTSLKTVYPEGMTWTNFEPYGTKSKDPHYEWKGGKILGNVNKGVGCAAFAFILSDAAFGTLQARVVNEADKFSLVRPGDILRINGNSHSVIVLQKTAVGVIIAEGNYNKSVHWGRALSKDEVNKADFIVTRYPENFDTSGADAVEEVIEQGTEGENLTWTLTDRGTLTISGSGAMRDFLSNDRPKWEESGKSIATVVIEQGVTSIGNYAFYNSASLLVISIPNSVKAIGNDAFYNCSALLSATLPKEGELATIGNRAFKACTGLKHIDFPPSIESVGAAAFSGCTNVNKIRFMPGNKGAVTLGDNLFTECRNLQYVTLPDKADCISSGMFLHCEYLTELHIPAGIQAVRIDGGQPFSGCERLNKIYFAGSEDQWNNMEGMTALGEHRNKIEFDIPFPDPFAPDPDDPGDGMNSNGHVHSWAATEWNHDDSYHWHECTAAGCTVTNNKDKSGYAAHTYGSWVTDVDATSSQSGSRHRDCTACSYRQTESIPATGGSSGGSSGGSGSTGGSSGGSSGGSWGSGGSSWGSGSTGSGSGSTGGTGNTNTSKPETPETPDSSTDTDSTGSNTTDDSSGNTDGTGNTVTEPDNSDDSESTASSLKQLKTKFKKQIKTDLKKQIKVQLKPELKKQLKSELKLTSKGKLRKQLKTELKPQVKAKLKKQLKKQYGDELGKEFADIFNPEFNALFNKLFNGLFNQQYKQFTAKQAAR